MAKAFSGFLSSTGQTYTEPKPVVPLIIARKDRWKVVGTAFYIGAPGLLVTAKHCVEEYSEENGDMGLCIFHWCTEKEGHFYIRPITRGWKSPVADISVLVAAPMHNKLGEALPVQSLSISIERPPPGTLVATFAYPDTKVGMVGSTTEIRLAPKLTEGVLQDYYPAGRDRSMINWPVYQTDMEIGAGCSGGPVFSERGTVFAVNTSSVDLVQGSFPVSFITPIDYILDAEIAEVSVDGEPSRSYTVRELARGGHITFSPDFPT